MWSAIRVPAALQRAEVRSQDDEAPDGAKIIVADMTVAYKLIRETFRSKVTLEKPKLQILA